MAQSIEKITTQLQRSMDSVTSEIEINRSSITDTLSLSQDNENGIEISLTDVEDLIAGIIKVCRGSIYFKSDDDLMKKVTDKLIK